ncbi:hypothetical protein ACQRD0_06150 [Streptococcus alactolyticus]|uniref:hypothetical protein n=1 Tax=Streptococcus alactolyticus TaxID=29389 RepID=UPI003CFE43B4
MNNKEKTCMVCGRIITDPNNKTGLCPKHQKQGNNILGLGVLASVGFGLKKYGPKAVKALVKVIKK